MNILIVDDEPDVRKSLSNFLEKLGHNVFCAKDGLSGLREFHLKDLHMVITDLRMPGMDGLELLRRIKVIEQSSVDVIVVTGHGDIDNAIHALKYGAFDYLQKPINVHELAITLERSAEYSADRRVPLLIEGESGTGKELIARYTHHFNQQNSTLPFVAINCGAFASELIEAELFGHEAGAFTGASKTGRIGKLEAAAGGTIFFDEIGEMPLKLQVKLLRVLEEKTLHRVGGLEEVPLDIRIICATNKDLHQEVEKKQFRLDLYYRINMGHIRIPPLNQRRDDILPLAQRFAGRAFRRQGKKFLYFTRAAENFLLDFIWPGNVRQLKNAMERLAILKMHGQVGVDDLSFYNGGSALKPVGIIPNPASGKDIRRLVAYGSVFDNNEKVNIVRRVVLGLDAMGVKDVLMMPDYFGIGVRAIEDLKVSSRITFLDMKRDNTQDDSARAAELLNELGVACIITLGGDGTNRVVAKTCAETPLLPISTGTNNVFPSMVEGTLAGMAAGFTAIDSSGRPDFIKQAPRLILKYGSEIVDMALIDIVVSKPGFIGSRAVWDISTIQEIFLSRAEPGNIGFSSIGGNISELPPTNGKGIHIVIGPGAHEIKAPIAPGLIRSVPVKEYRLFEPGEEMPLAHTPAMIALDGERERIERKKTQVAVEIDLHGPWVIDIPRALQQAAKQRLFHNPNPSRR